MAVFIAIALLCTLLLLALALHPLWRARRLPGAALVLLSGVVVAGLYLQLGRPDAIDYVHRPPPADIDAALAELEAIAAAQPGDIEARVLLARSYLQLGRYREAQAHLADALKQRPDDAGLMVDYAESLFRASPPRQPDARAGYWIDRAVATEPGNQRAVFFKGILQLQAGQAAEAAATWEALLPMLDAATADALRAQIGQARAQAGLPPLAAPDALSVMVTVDIDPALRAGLAKDAVLFVFARPVSGSGPPVAAVRIASPEFPVQVRLSDADSVMPTAKLSSLERFVLSARLSASGSVQAGADDLRSEPLTLQSDKLAPVTLTLRQSP